MSRFFPIATIGYTFIPFSVSIDIKVSICSLLPSMGKVIPEMNANRGPSL